MDLSALEMCFFINS